MPVSLDEVRSAAALARIGLKEGEAERFAGELSRILAYVDRLRAVDTAAVVDGPVFADALPPDRDLARRDEAVREAVIQAFPDRLGDLLRVPGVFPNRSTSSSR